MNIEFEEKNPPIDPKEIELFELTTSYKLPDSYKMFLLEQNGGIIKDEYEIYGKSFSLGHKIIVEDGPHNPHFFYRFWDLSIMSPEEEGIYKYSIYDEKVNDPDPYPIEYYGNYGVQLIIASGSAYETTTLCLSPGENYGKIYVFDDHMDYDETYRNCAKISDSFEEFMNTFELFELNE